MKKITITLEFNTEYDLNKTVIKDRVKKVINDSVGNVTSVKYTEVNDG